MSVMSAGDATGFCVLTHHVVGLPSRDVHEVIRRAAGREPAISEIAAEAVRVDILYPSLLASPPEHGADS